MTYRGILESQYFSMPASGTGTTVSAVFTKTGVRPIRIVAYRIIMLIGTQEGPDFQTSSVKCYSIPFCINTMRFARHHWTGVYHTLPGHVNQFYKSWLRQRQFLKHSIIVRKNACFFFLHISAQY